MLVHGPATHYIAYMARREEKELLQTLGNRVRQLRAARRLTMRDAAQRSGLSLRFFAQLEAGSANISVARLASVAGALGVTLSEIVAQPRLSRRHVALLGLRGAGKSTIGRMLAASLGVDFFELDDRVERAAGLALPEIFSIHGETYYRRLEEQCVDRLLREEAPAVIALSGGIVHNEKAFEMVRRECLTVWLRASPTDHMRRVMRQGDRRPMAGRPDAMADLNAILHARAPLYSQSDLTIDNARRGCRATVQALLEELDRAGWKAGI